jgi:hypothetical protein
MGQGQKLGNAAGLNRDMIEKSRRFALEFSKRDLNMLCREIEHGDFPVGVQVVVYLLRLPERQRWSFLAKTIKGRWSCRRLAAEIQRKTRRRPMSGRTPVIENQEDAVQKLLKICEQWDRLHRVITGNKNGDGAAGLQLSPGIRNQLDGCDSAVDRLYKRLLKAQ